MKKKSFFQTPFTKTSLLAALVLVGVSLSNCKQDPTDSTGDLIEQTGDAALAALAKQAPDRFFYDADHGVQGRYIVMFKDSYLRPAILDETESEVRPSEVQDRSASRRQAVESGVERFLEEAGIAQDKVVATYGQVIAGFAANLTPAQVQTLLDDPRIASIEQDMEIELTDKLESVEKPGDGSAEAQTLTCGVVRHGNAGNGSASTKWIWIVDTGIQSTHPDLNVITNPAYAKSFVGGTFEDCNGHGTHVAGTAAAKNNAFGVVGMSAGAKVVPIKIMGGCGSTYFNANLLAGLNHIAANDISGDVVNLSLGGYFGFGCGVLSPLRAAILNLGNSGTWVSIAAGNSSDYAGYYQPACIDGNRILTVANMTCQNVWNNGSNYNLATNGSPIDWIAVGTNVYSTFIGSSYGTMTGTSMSAPHVAGIVHWRQANPLQNGIVVKSGVIYKVASRI
jgi:hypothetical protein